MPSPAWDVSYPGLIFAIIRIMKALRFIPSMLVFKELFVGTLIYAVSVTALQKLADYTFIKPGKTP